MPLFEINAVRTSEADPFSAVHLDVGGIAVLKASRGGEIFVHGLGPCVGYVGFDRRQKILFGAHLLPGADVDNELRLLIAHLRRLRINITDSAIAGGRTSPEDLSEFPKYGQVFRESVLRAAQLAKRSYIQPGLSIATVYDDLEVTFDPKDNFSIRHVLNSTESFT